jgi:hypothetical protein
MRTLRNVALLSVAVVTLPIAAIGAAKIARHMLDW